MIDVHVRGSDDPARIAARTVALIAEGEHVAWIGRERLMRKVEQVLMASDWAAARYLSAPMGDGRTMWLWTPTGAEPEAATFIPKRSIG